MSKPVSAAEYARIRGVSKPAVAKAIRTGRISTTAGPNGQKLIDPDRANVEWAANTDIARQRQGAPQEFEKTQPLARESAARQAGEGAPSSFDSAAAPAHAPHSGSSPRSIAGSLTLLEEKTRSERLRVERQEMELAERRGQLVSREAIRAAWSVKLIAARELLQSIPDRLAAVIAAEHDASVIHRLLTEEIRRAMQRASVSDAAPLQ